jgi:hypothetical protein
VLILFGREHSIRRYSQNTPCVPLSFAMITYVDMACWRAFWENGLLAM